MGISGNQCRRFVGVSNVNAWTPCGGPVLGAGGEPKENYIYKSVFTNRRILGHAEVHGQWYNVGTVVCGKFWHVSTLFDGGSVDYG